jgi:hypothetical protein
LFVAEFRGSSYPPIGSRAWGLSNRIFVFPIVKFQAISFDELSTDGPTAGVGAAHSKVWRSLQTISR